MLGPRRDRTCFVRRKRAWARSAPIRLDLGNGVIFSVIRQRGGLVGSSGHVRLRHAAVDVWVDGVIARAITGPDIDAALAAAERLAEERE